MRFILVRHGELAEMWQPDLGHNDPPLSDLGRRQAEAILGELEAQAALGRNIAALYTSPFRAARETAAVVGDGLGLEPEVSPALATLSPEVVTLDGSSEAALSLLQQQVWSAIETLKELQEPEANLVLVTHQLPVRLAVCRALSMPIADMRRFEVEAGSLTTIEFRLQNQRMLLAGLNESCHLDLVASA